MALISSVEANEHKVSEHEWCVDSGASQHMTFELITLSNVEMFEDPKPVFLGDK